MPARLAYALLTLTLCAAAAVLGVYLASSRGAERGGVEVGAGGWAGYLRPPAARAPDFALRDQDGRAASLAQYRGKPFAITFVYSTCEDTCPAMLDQVRGAVDRSGARLDVLAVSVDPANDTAARARRFLTERRLTGRARFLLGDEAQLAPVWRGYGIQPQAGGLEHTASVVLVDAQGRQRVGYPFDKLTPDALAHDMRRLTRATP